MFLVLRKTPLNPSTRIPSFICITSRFFSHHPNPNKAPISDEPTSACYDELVAIAGRSGDLTTLRRLLNKRYKDGFFNTSNTFKFLTDTNLNTNLDHLLQTLSNLDKGFARKNAFDSLIAHLCKSNRIEESLRVIDAMIEKEIGVKACTFHPLLNALTRKKCFDEALRILEKMKDHGVTIDITSYNYILSSYCFHGDLAAAAGVLEKIVEQGLKVDPRTYDALVMGACRVWQVEGALVLLRRMEEDILPPIYSTHTHVIRSLLGLGCFAQAVEFVMAFVGRNKDLDTENFGYLGSHLIKRKRVKEAKLIFGEMEKRGLVMGDKLRAEYKNFLLIPDLR